MEFILFSHLPSVRPFVLTPPPLLPAQNYFVIFPPPTQSTSVDDPVKDHFHGVPQQNHGFVGRADILARMEAEIVKDRSSNRLALSGLGGMGKTQLMLQYCYLHRKAYQFVF